MEAAFRYELKHFDDAGPPAAVCLEVDEGGGAHDPTATLVAQIAKFRRAYPASECEVSAEGVVHRHTRTRAILLGAGPVEWSAKTEAHVRGRYFRNATDSARPLYRVVRESYGWEAVGPVIRGVPF